MRSQRMNEAELRCACVDAWVGLASRGKCVRSPWLSSMIEMLLVVGEDDGQEDSGDQQLLRGKSFSKGPQPNRFTPVHND